LTNQQGLRENALDNRESGISIAHHEEGVSMAESLSADECATQLRVLSEPERLRILELLMMGPHAVSAIADVLDVSVALASHHLSVLKREGYVQAQKSGRQVIYEIVSDRLVQGARRRPEVRLGCCVLQFPN
jgi:ArsR family transcriptional regulator